MKPVSAVLSRAVFLLTQVCVVSCGGNPRLDLSTLDRSCKADADCMLVSASPCTSCGHYAINKRSSADARAQLQSLRPLCDPGDKLLCIPEEDRAACVDERCTVVNDGAQ